MIFIGYAVPPSISRQVRAISSALPQLLRLIERDHFRLPVAFINASCPREAPLENLVQYRRIISVSFF
jgi:hypothetical protein